jgi:hypothetical protein
MRPAAWIRRAGRRSGPLPQQQVERQPPGQETGKNLREVAVGERMTLTQDKRNQMLSIENPTSPEFEQQAPQALGATRSASRVGPPK